MVKVKRKGKPAFHRMNYGRKSDKKIKDNWRRPRGADGKRKVGCRYAGKLPLIGYGNKPAVRGLHPCGLPELLVNNEAELAKAGAKQGCVVRIAAGVGGRKREAMRKKAAALKLRILN